jgi:ribokinase
MAVFNFGSINIDHVYRVGHFVTPGETLSSKDYEAILGGKGANQSIACAKAGIKTFHVGSVHCNDANMLTPMLDAAVEMKFVSQQNVSASGHAIIQVNDEGENAIILYPGANHLLNEDRINTVLSKAASHDWVLLQNETNEIENIIHLAHNAGLKVAFNPAPMTDAVVKLPFEKISLLIVNEVEAMQLTATSDSQQAKQALMKMADKLEILLTLGKRGVHYLHQQTDIFVPAYNVAAVDTTAAGDTFIGFFLAHFAKGADVTQALKIACAASAISVTRNGASPSIPTIEEVGEFLNAHS